MDVRNYEKLKQLRVFVSSTYRDLIEHRKAVLESIHSLGNFTSDMIYWPADERDPASYSVDQLKSCDLIILILAHRYGTTLAGDKRSITEIEYDTAKKLQLPVIPFLVDPKHEWPFIHVERESYDALEEFKKRVQIHHTAKLFTTPDNLARLVTEAVVQFVATQTGVRLGKQFALSTRLEKPTELSSLIETPDTTVVLGAAEDGLPLLLRVNRSMDLEEFFTQIYVSKPDLQRAFPDKVIDELRSSLGDRRRVHPVVMSSNNTETMYITRRSLSIMFRSLMSSLVGRGGKTRIVPEFDMARQLSESADTARRRVTLPKDQEEEESEIEYGLESTAGANRFLGISLNSGRLYSVGRKGNKWVEWHPFLPENLHANLPATDFRIRANYVPKEEEERLTGSLEELESKIIDFAIKNLPGDGIFREKIDFRVQRQTIAELCLRIVDRVGDYHKERGLIHGDLKPSNILLLDRGPVLIDGFDVKEGAIAPGWTPFWSGPELVTSEPLTFQADIYPLGRILVEVMGAYLIGEVKKFRVPTLPSGRNEFDVFCNPSVHLLPNVGTLSDESFKHWKAFLERTLQYHPQQRPSLKEFKRNLEELLVRFPLSGSVQFRIPGQICATEMLDGRQLLARVINDFFQPRERPPIDDFEQTITKY